MLVDGRPVPGGIFDFALFFFHCARPLLDRGSGAHSATHPLLTAHAPCSTAACMRNSTPGCRADDKQAAERTCVTPGACCVRSMKTSWCLKKIV